MSSKQVITDWPFSSTFGWGLRGLGYALNWPGVAVSAHPQLDAVLPPDDGRRFLLAERVEQSRRVQSQLLSQGPAVIKLPEPVLVALGNNLTPQPSAWGRILHGTPHVGCAVFEDIDIVRVNVGNLKQFDVVTVASRWNQEVLDDLGVKAELCHEGVDPVIFNSGTRHREKNGKFRVFSGGKAEWRKGQDLVIQAFAEFARTHDDAVLVAAWGSPFSWTAKTFEGKWEHGAPPGLHIDRPNYHAWVQRAGVKPHQFEWVDPRPNWQMPAVYSTCDVAVFPNRCEGGTNFVAMEAVACGLPTIINPAFGQVDLGSNATTIDGYGLVEALERAYEGRFAADIGVPGYWTWERHCRQLAWIIDNA